MQHRSDIDGLRAVAVLSVVLYHLGFSERISGGFVGVDVFFVISGYLITGILQNDVEQERLSIAEFYNRRVRRIFPALFVVHAFCLAASVILLLPLDVRDVGRDVLGSLAFVSNVVYSHASGYFDQAAKDALLLHTWSLSVEEQFYIVLPLLLLALRRVTPRVRLGVLAAISVASFIGAQWMVGVDSSRAFYLVQYRAWELLLGSLLALGVLPTVKQRAIGEVLGLAGVGLILVGVFVIRGTTPFPGVWALPPSVGAFFILYSGHSGADVKTLASRALGWAPLRFVGNISYSLYLWHWPLIVLHQRRLEAMTTGARVAILALAFAAAVVSYRFVEIPFRRKPYRRNARSTLRIAAIGTAVLGTAAVGIPAAAARLRPSLRANAAIAYLKYSPRASTRSGTCFLTSGSDDPSLFRKDLCLVVRTDRKNFLLMGDSHAAHLWPGLQPLRPDINFLQATASGCSALHRTYGSKRCTALLTSVFNEFLPTHHLDAIFLSGRWLAGNLPELRRTIAYLRPFATRIVVLGPIVEYDQPLPSLLARSIAEYDPDLPARHKVASKRAVDRLFARLVPATGAEYFSVYDAVCPHEKCDVWASPDVPMQFDYGHLTAAGATVVLTRLGPDLFR